MLSSGKTFAEETGLNFSFREVFPLGVSPMQDCGGDPYAIGQEDGRETHFGHFHLLLSNLRVN
jgi:hypothetical protein